MKLLLGTLLAAVSLSAQIRTVGPEPGIQFGTIPSNLCTYGDYQRPLTSAFGGSCSTPFIKFDDFYVTAYTPGAALSMPSSAVSGYGVRVVVNGKAYPGINRSFTSFALNLADPNFQKYFFLSYVPNYVIPNGPSGTTTSHPLYVSMDGMVTDYAAWGANVNGIWTKGLWLSTQAQNSTDWLAAFQSFYAYAKNNQPKVRMSPHLSGMNDPAPNTFQQMFADVPALERETFNISSLATMGGFSRTQTYWQIQNVYWFANLAPRVFLNDPATRIAQWGTWLDNGDIHTALGLYALVRGPNTFFDLLSGSNYPLNPTAWLGIVRQLGSSTSPPTVIATATNKPVTSGYNLYRRTWQHGVAYLNMTGGTQTVSVPAGAKNWSGISISSLILGDGKGDVVVIPPTIIAGASVQGATAVLLPQ
jgi:hypothetical protein